MSYRVLAAKVGIHPVTLQRVLTGWSPNAGFTHIAAIVEALGLPLDFDPNAGVEEMRERQAWKKAQRLAAMVQGTSALEGQAMAPEAVRQMARRLAHQLLAGPKAKLWSEP